jgi:phospholipase/carboxylesterase
MTTDTANCEKAKGNVVIFFHGRGLGPESVSEVASSFAGARVLAPQGGVALSRGATWFENVSIGVARPESVAAAEERFLGWLDDSVDPQVRPWLCGFSNGGAFAGHLLLRFPAKFRGAAVLGAPLVLPPWPPGAFKGKPLLYCRGLRDEVIPSPMFEATEDYLANESGGEITICRYDAAHEISAKMAGDLALWFSMLPD